MTLRSQISLEAATDTVRGLLITVLVFCSAEYWVRLECGCQRQHGVDLADQQHPGLDNRGRAVAHLVGN